MTISTQQNILPNFDDYAEIYDDLVAQNIKASGFSPSYFDEHKIKTLVQDFSGLPRCDSPVQFLNFGCGIGKSEFFINKYFTNATIVSADISVASLEKARKRNQSFKNITYRYFETIQELTTDTKFDIIYAANVFHHIPQSEHLTTLNHLRSLLKPNGFFYIFEHNPANPLTRKAFYTCPFDSGCEMIPSIRLSSLLKQGGYTKTNRNFIVFFPQFLRLLLPFEKFLNKIPFGAQYYIKAQ